MAKLCAFHVHLVNLKDRLRNIETNRANLAHGRLPSLVVRFSAATPWHFDAARWAPSTASFSTDSTWLCDVRLSGSGHRNRWHFMSTRPNRKRRRDERRAALTKITKSPCVQVAPRFYYSVALAMLWRPPHPPSPRPHSPNVRPGQPRGKAGRACFERIKRDQKKMVAVSSDVCTLASNRLRN